MSDYNEGDLVRIERGEVVVQDRAKKSDFGTELYLPAEKNGTYLHVLVERGWTITVIERAKPALPTEPFTTIRAVYLPAGNANTKVTHLTLLPRSEGSNESRWAYSNGISVDNADLPRIQSFEVITAPIAETAKKVLVEVRGFMEARSTAMHDNDVTMFQRATFLKDLDMLAASLGVTGELGE